MRTIWLDAHLSSRLARWLSDTFSVQAAAVRDLGFRQAEDPDIFFAARKVAAIVVTRTMISWNCWSATAARQKSSG